MIIKPKYRGFICATAHPEGCYKNVEDMVNSALNIDPQTDKTPKNVVVIGSSSGYGLASRIISAFTYKAKTIGLSFEKPSTEKRTATAGFYNNQAFDTLACQHTLPSKTINGDAFSIETKDELIAACKDLFGTEKIDLLIYSLAAPRRIHPVTQETHSSVIKPIGNAYTNKTVDFHTGEISETTLLPATEAEIADTIKVMGGEDWSMWIDRLIEEDLLADGFQTIAYSYIGPVLTHPIYKNGTIGKAKEDLANYAETISTVLKPLNGRALISVNKALVTQASSAIPVVPLYISLLYKVMKQKGSHEGCFDQIKRLFTQAIYTADPIQFESDYSVRMDDREMTDDVQAEIVRLWPMITTENIEDITDIIGYRNEFFSLYGFGRDDIDYDKDVAVF